MKTTAELKIEISGVRIRKATIMGANVDCILVEASKLSLNDIFMSHKPRTESEKKFKAILTEVIEKGIEDFYRPAMDPSFADKEKTKIHYMAGEKPAVGKSYNWWKKTVKGSDFCIGTKAQYVAFLGVLIKLLVTKGWAVYEAWDAVCNDSKKLGHYWNSDNAKHQFEDTGSREICGFFDLVNTYKILAEDEGIDVFWLAGGSCDDCGDNYPLAVLVLDYVCDYIRYGSVAWLVLKK